MRLLLTEASTELIEKIQDIPALKHLQLECCDTLEKALELISIDNKATLLVMGDRLDPTILRPNMLQVVGLPWAVIVGKQDLDLVLECGKAGASCCIQADRINDLVAWVVEREQTIKSRARDRLQVVSKQKEKVPAPEGLIGESLPMQEVYQRIQKVGPTRSTVLIRGETGTGKELVAKAIHLASDRSTAPFVAVNCAAIPETLIESELFGHEKGSFTGAAGKRIGLIEEAEGGTLFLDEIGELPPEAQARLLRFIQESEVRAVGSNKSRRVDVRLIAATHRDLQALAKTGEFRADLYYRINVFRIFLPLLRQRGNDIFLIADHLLTKAALKHNKPGLYLTPEAIDAISNYAWDGNVRELENTIERAAIMTSSLAIDPLALEIDTSESEDPGVDDVHHRAFQLDQAADEVISSMHSHNQGVSLEEPGAGVSLEEYFQQFVIENQGHMNETELAKKLGISRKCLWERRQRFGITRDKRKEKKTKSQGK